MVGPELFTARITEWAIHGDTPFPFGIAASSLTLTMLLPFTLRFSLSAADILRFAESTPREGELTSTEVLREVALQYESTYDSNARQIRILEACFRLAIVFLVAEVAFWLTALTRGAL